MQLQIAALEAAGVDLQSEAASSAVMEFICALDDLAQEFGYKVIKQLIEHGQSARHGWRVREIDGVWAVLMRDTASGERAASLRRTPMTQG